jgi:hypothetical protein
MKATMGIAGFKRGCLRAALAGGLCVATVGITAAQVATVSFQNGADGYAGTFDRRVSDKAAEEVDGSTVPTYYLDGYKADLTSPDAQALLRFDNCIGDNPGQIPAGAAILSARLVLTTSLAGNAQTSGPYGVAGMLRPFDSTTSYFVDFNSTTDMGSRGPWWQDGSATRPVGGYGVQIQGGTDSANVTPIVQSWANGASNYGLTVQAGLSDSVSLEAGTADGWSIRTTGFPFSDARPKLIVSYTTAPVQISTFQDGRDGYADTTMVIVHSGLNALIEDTADLSSPERTEDASTLNQTFLDGVFFSSIDGVVSSPDDLALVKFNNVFGAQAGQVPTDKPVAKAWIVITTGDTHADARTSGPFSAYTMLRPWDKNSLHSSFGAVNGLQVGEGDIGPALDTQDGFIRGAEAWFDVTAYLEGVRTGAADHGIAIQGDGTADGWQIHATGSTTPEARPRLVVYSADLRVE